jgi:hypothetical protein
MVTDPNALYRMAVVPIAADGTFDPAALQRIAVLPINTSGVFLPGEDAARAQFIGEMLTLTGDTRLFWIADNANTTTSTDRSLNASTITWDATVASRFTQQGFGFTQSFTTSQWGATADRANLSFGTGAADSAFSIIVLANITDSAAARRLITKAEADSTDQEWFFQVASTDVLQLILTDQSAGVSASRASNAAVTQGSLALHAVTYTAATGGATAANDITIYQNGLVVASTATNNGAYVAMEDLTAQVVIGAVDGAAAANPAGSFGGSMALAIVCQKSLTASDHWAIYQLCKGYYGI